MRAHGGGVGGERVREREQKVETHAALPVHEQRFNHVVREKRISQMNYDCNERRCLVGSLISSTHKRLWTVPNNDAFCSLYITLVSLSAHDC